MIGLQVKVHKVVLLAEVLQFGFGLAQRLLDSSQLVVNEFDGVFRNEVLLFQTTGDIFVHQQVDKLYYFQFVGTFHYNGSNGSLLTDSAYSKTVHLLDKRGVTIEPKVHLTIADSLGVKAVGLGDTDTVVAVVNPFTLFVFTADVNRCWGTFSSLTKNKIILAERFICGMEAKIAIVQETYLVHQTHRLGNAALKLHLKRRVFVHFTGGETAFFHIGYFNTHLLDDTFREGIRFEDGYFVVYVLHRPKVHRSHDGSGIVIVVFLD